MSESNSAKLLLVEDDNFMSSILAKKLAASGYDIHTAEDGPACFAELDSFHPDLVLLDVVMPNIDGFGVLEKMQETENWQSIPVIMLSNSNEPDKIQRAEELGVKDYLVKANLTPQEIVEKIATFLQAK